MHEQPNIVLIVTDQHRFDCLGAAGNPAIATPNLDALAAGGTLFRSGYSPAPSCVPARASLFTGLSPNSTGRLGYQDRVPWEYEGMLAEVLGEGGYQTHCVGKTHFYPQGKLCGFQSIDSYEANQNFDGLYVNDYHEWLAARTENHEWDHGLDSNSWIARPSHLPEELHNNTWVASKGIDFLRRRDRTRPFFLNLSFHRPHPPIDPPAVYWDMYEPDDMPMPATGSWSERYRTAATDPNAWHGELPERDTRAMRRGYYAQISHIDNQIGRFILALKRMKSIGPTAFIFTSDHGEMLGDHWLYRKSYAYEGSAHVPFIVTLPDGRAGGINDTAVSLTDIYPTVIDIAGIDPPRPIDGRSLVDICRGTADDLDREYIHGEHSSCYSEDNATQFLTDGKQKFVWNPVTGEAQLFDLSIDPYETVDRATEAEYSDDLDRWKKRLIAELQPRALDGLVKDGELVPGVVLPPTRGGAAFVEG